MRASNLINRYIFRQLLSPFLISLFFLTFVFLMTRIPEITNLVVNYDADISSVILMIVFTIPRFLEFTIPMSVMISVLLTFMKMSGDNEIIAIKGAGTSIYKLLPPVAVFCTLSMILTMVITVFGVSWGKLSIKEKTIELARTSIDAALQERQFNSALKNIMIYIGSVNMKTRELKNVFIEDRRTKGVISQSIAPAGRLVGLKDQGMYTIKLYDGVINQVDMDDHSVTHLKFGDYDINIDLNALGSDQKGVSKELDERNIVDLIQFIRSGIQDRTHLNQALMELHEKFSIPISCLTLGILAFPLGIQSASLRKASGFSLGITFFIFYYFMLAAGWSAVETGGYPPVLGMWLPNFVMGFFAVYFLVKNAKEDPVEFPAFLISGAEFIKAKLRK